MSKMCLSVKNFPKMWRIEREEVNQLIWLCSKRFTKCLSKADLDRLLNKVFTTQADIYEVKSYQRHLLAVTENNEKGASIKIYFIGYNLYECFLKNYFV